MTHRRATLVALLSVALAGPAYAQADMAAMARTAAANQLGVLEYCQSQGSVGTDAVAAQRSVITRLPPSPAGTDASEAIGKQGTMTAPNGTKTTLASIASGQGTTVDALCKRLGSSATQSAAAYSQAGTMPTMPGMPAMPSMAGMPQVPGMPQMPGMPAMPGVPAR